ncbi:MAG: aldo/keto reductase [Ignavibacteriales bacterium]|nr:aldo/keto reductase [Ignavibacteriales bacterium]
MRYRLLGKTGIRISEIGFGAWGIGGSMWLGAVDSESMTALKKAVDAGINFFDTALVYGDGHSEVLIGKLLRESSEQLYVASKVPPKNRQWPARPGVPVHEAFTKKYIIESTHISLKHMKLERLNLQQLHVWRDDWVAADEIWEAVELLKRDGKIGAFGISINDHEPASVLAAAQTGLVDSFQVIYNIFDQSPEDELLPYCREHEIGIIARVPLDEGGLTGRITTETVFPEKDWRNNYFRGDRKQQVFDRTEQLKELLGAEARTLPELALRYILSHPAVSTVIPGMRTAAHVDSNAEVSDSRGLSEALLSELKKHRWIRNFYKS